MASEKKTKERRSRIAGASRAKRDEEKPQPHTPPAADPVAAEKTEVRSPASDPAAEREKPAPRRRQSRKKTDGSRGAADAAISEAASGVGAEPEAESVEASDAPSAEVLEMTAPPATPLVESDRRIEFSIKPQVLKAGLAAVVAALPARLTLPVLQNVLLESDGEDHLRMTATDLDTTVTRRVPASVSTPGAVLVMGRKLLEIAREIPDSCMLDVRLAEATLVLQCSETRTRYRLPTLPADEFPAPPSIPWEEASAAVPGEVLALLIERTAFAASTEETRPILNGVLWTLGEGEMGMVATDGHRLARSRVPVTEAVAREGCILHPKALAMVARLPAERETVRVAFAQNHVGFRGDGWEILTRTIEGPYPDYQRVLPKDNDKVLVADRGALAAAVRRMAILASDQTHRIRMSLGTDLLMMRISVETPELGEAHEDVAVDYQGDPLEIGFNAQYVLEVLRFLPPGDVRMTFRAPERAATLSPVQDETGAWSETLLMPLRLV